MKAPWLAATPASVVWLVLGLESLHQVMHWDPDAEARCTHEPGHYHMQNTSSFPPKTCTRFTCHPPPRPPHGSCQSCWALQLKPLHFPYLPGGLTHNWPVLMPNFLFNFLQFFWVLTDLFYLCDFFFQIFHNINCLQSLMVQSPTC